MRKNTWLLQKVSATQKGLDCKTVGFFSKSVKKSVKKIGVRVLLARNARAVTRPWGERKRNVFLASLPSLALCFQPRSRPSFWLLERNKYAKIRTVLQSKKGLKNVVGIPPNLNERGRFLQSANCILVYPRASVLVSAHCFKNELYFLCSVLVSTHRFKNDLCIPRAWVSNLYVVGGKF